MKSGTRSMGDARYASSSASRTRTSRGKVRSAASRGSSRSTSGSSRSTSPASPPRGRTIISATISATQASSTPVPIAIRMSHHMRTPLFGWVCHAQPRRAGQLRCLGGGRVVVSGLGGDGRVLKGRQRGAALFDRLTGRQAAAGGEVVAGGDLGEPLSEPVQVRLGLLHLRIGGPPARRLLLQFRQQLRGALDDLGVLRVPLGVELGD